MAESRHWLIGEAIRAALGDIVVTGAAGSVYWYKPEKSVRVSRFDGLLDDATLAQVFALRAGEETHTEESTGDPTSGGIVGAAAEFFLLMLRRHNQATENPYQESDPTRAKVVDRMVRDALRRLWIDVTLGGLANNISQGSLLIDRDVWVPGWACAEARFTVLYSYPARTP